MCTRERREKGEGERGGRERERERGEEGEKRRGGREERRERGERASHTVVSFDRPISMQQSYLPYISSPSTYQESVVLRLAFQLHTMILQCLCTMKNEDFVDIKAITDD